MRCDSQATKERMRRAQFTRSEWTEEKIAQLRKLVRLGMTSEEIGRFLGVTGNAVIGKCSRLGIRLARSHK